MKILITSQKQLHDNTRSQDKRLQRLLEGMAGYSKDLCLYPLDDEESRQFLSAGLVGYNF